MIKEQATPRPWQVTKHYKNCITSENKGIIAQCSSFPSSSSQDEANALLIVKSVNCHDELVDTIRISIGLLAYNPDKIQIKQIQELLKQALFKATKE